MIRLSVRLQRHFQLWQQLEQIPHQPDIRDLEDRRLGVLVDGDDGAGVLDPSQVLDRAADADGHVQFRRDDLAGLADLQFVGDVAGVDRRARGADGGAELVGEGVPKAVACIEEGFADAMAVMALPEKYRRRLRTTNMQERLNEEIRRRERVIRIFPNDESALRLIGALLAEQNEVWQERRYLDMDEFAEWAAARIAAGESNNVVALAG